MGSDIPSWVCSLIILTEVEEAERHHITPFIMERIEGTATGIRCMAHVSGDRNGISTRHHTIFKIGTTTVIFTSISPPIISEGDRLIVAGKMKGKALLIADAYINRSIGIKGDAGAWDSLIGMILCTLTAAMGLGWALLWPLFSGSPHSVSELKWLIAAVGAFFFGFALYCLCRWLRISEAVRLVRNEPKALPPTTPFSRL